MKARLSNLLFLIVLNLRVVSPLSAETPVELAIGVPAYNAEEKVSTGNALMHRLVRSSVSAPLLVPKQGVSPEQALFTLVLVDSFQVDPSLTTWSYRLREGVRFSNGQSLRGADACDSLIRCGRDRPADAFTIVECEVRTSQVGESIREWIELGFDVSLNTRTLQRGVIDFIATCPVLEARTRGIFGEDFGVGSNFLGAGEYKLAGFQLGRSYRLERFQRDRSGLTPDRQTVELLTFSSMKDALTALRVGTVGLFFNTDPEIAAVASGDETLRVAQCADAQVIFRRGYHFRCDRELSLSSVTWNLAPALAEGEGLQ